MKNIRKSVFETNSSSTHSIFIDEDTKLLDTIEPRNGRIEIEYGEYGWEEELFTDPMSKAMYALTYTQYFDTQKNRDMLREVIKDHTGAKVVNFIELSQDYDPEGYIDHQSCEEPASFFASPEALKRFLFNPKSNFKTDNDNH